MAGDEASTPSGGQLPAGTLTFVLTDVEGSTELWDSAPAAMAEAQRTHDELIASVVAAHGGQLVKSKGEGDSTFSVFVDPTSAVLAAERIRDSIADTTWPTPTPIRVRVGVSTGVAELRDGDYFGAAVVRAARVRSLARGDEVLLAASTYSLIADSLLRDRAIEDRGEHELKGLQRPERVYALHEGAAPRKAPRSRTPLRPVLIGVSATVAVAAIVLAIVLASDSGGNPPASAEPTVDIASVEFTTTEFVTQYEIIGTADGVEIPPYQVRVLARDPFDEDVWLWSYPASVAADGTWTGELEVPTDGSSTSSLRLSAVVILPPPGDTSATGPSELPLTGPGTELEEDLRANGPDAADVVAVSDDAATR